MDLKQNAFLRQWISPHRHRKYIHFFTINAHLEYYFFYYKEIATFSEGKKKRAVAKRCGLLFHSRQKNMTERLQEKYKSTIKVEDCCGIQDE